MTSPLRYHKGRCLPVSTALPPPMTDPRRVSAPLIAISTYVESARWGAWDLPAALVPYGYVEAVAAAGARPVLVPPADAAPERTVAALDGLVLAGGSDLDPGLYNAEPHPCTQGIRGDRDCGEAALLRAALAAELPVLGICRGLELLNILLGGDLIQHLPDELGHDEHRGEPGRFAEHEIRVEPGTQLGRRLDGHPRVKSHHHQGLGTLGDDLEPFAWAADGIVEAVEHRHLPFVAGVLWHPEAGDDRRLLAALTEAACDHRARRHSNDPDQEVSDGRPERAGHRSFD